MAKRIQLGATILACSVGALFAIVACGSDADENTFPGASSSGASGSSSGGFNTSSSGGDADPPCTGLQCKQVACPGGGTTSLSGKVYLPEGTIPLYNAIVYVPNAPLSPFPSGATCDQCGTAPSGSPIATALTDATGSFTLKNVPVGVDFPLVIQIGRWRRQITIQGSKVQQCADAKLDPTETRLPRNKTEGDIPQIAITTGGADSLECFLRKLGIEDSEITVPSGTGRVHLYQGSGGAPPATLPGAPSANSLWDDPAELKKHDIVILSCEGSEYNNTKSEAARKNLRDYLDAGGRVFASHFHYTWYKNTGSGAAGGAVNPLSVTANWVNNGNASPQDQKVTIDQTFAKGKDFATWMDTVKGTTAPGSGLVPMTELRRNVTSVPASGQPAETSRRWLYATEQNDDTKFFTFNTPLGKPADQQCGRAVYTDIHVSSGDDSSGTFPNNCNTTGLTEQEKALVFLLMDLAACIQDDTKPPVPPPSDPGVK